MNDKQLSIGKMEVAEHYQTQKEQCGKASTRCRKIERVLQERIGKSNCSQLII